MVSRDQSSSRSAHGAAIRALTDARQNTRKYRFMMERSDRVVEDAIFIDPDDQQHPQKLAHASVLDFHEEVNQPEYTIKMNDFWQKPLRGEDGNKIKIEVPRNDVITKTGNGTDALESVIPDRSEIKTKTESVSLETLSHRWSGRMVRVKLNVDDPYHQDDTERVERVRLWLPPKAIKAAYSALNSALSKIDLLAQTRAPIESDPDPV